MLLISLASQNSGWQLINILVIKLALATSDSMGFVIYLIMLTFAVCCYPLMYMSGFSCMLYICFKIKNSSNGFQ